MRWYRNNRDGTFTDVTDQAGVAGRNLRYGRRRRDYNNDGFPDLFVTGTDVRFSTANKRRRTFTRRHDKAGLAAGMPGWTRPRSGSTTQRTGFSISSSAVTSSMTCARAPGVRREEQGRQPLLPLLHSPCSKTDGQRAVA